LEALAADETNGRREELLRERAILIGKTANLGTAIGLHGFPTTLSLQLSHSEKRIETINSLLQTRATTGVKSLSAAEIREFLDRKMGAVIELSTGDPERAKRQLSKRIDKLILTPGVLDSRNVLVVTGDLRIFSEDDVMPFNSQVGNVGHYTIGKVRFDGFVLDPLAKAA
jgi:hypothetical protein